MKQKFIGQGAVSNPSNPFQKQEQVMKHLEGIDEVPEAFNPKLEIYKEHPKKIINKIDSPDLHLTHTINPYQGCEHGCVYCYARESHEYWGFSAGTDFERKIIVKENAPALLEKTFLQKSWVAAPISIAGNTDCYQPIEKQYKLTRRLLAVCLKYQHPVGIITKNSMILRDLDILQTLAGNDLVHVYLSITSLDEAMRRKLEPRTATASQKLKAIEKLTAAGIPVSIMLAPIIPAMNTHEIHPIIKAAANAGARTAGYTIVRLNGSIGQVFESWLQEHFPDRANKVLHQIKAMHGGALEDKQWGRRIKGEGPFAKIIQQLVESARTKYMPNGMMPPYNLADFRKGGMYALF